MSEKVHPEELDERIHQRVRLVVMSALAAQDELSFVELKELTAASDGNLSVHLAVLEKARYVEVDKRFVDRRPKTTYRITDPGREAFRSYLSALVRLTRTG